MPTKKTGRKVGRPTKYSKALADRICEAVAEGKFIADLCKVKGFPALSNMRLWLHEYPDFRSAYARARESSGEHEERRAAQIRDAMLAEVYPADVARVAIDTSLKLAKIRDPKTYGDKQTIELHTQFTMMSDDELIRFIGLDPKADVVEPTVLGAEISDDDLSKTIGAAVVAISVVATTGAPDGGSSAPV